ncbi:MAG: GRP family sugar transporter [Lactovum sp.]
MLGIMYALVPMICWGLIGFVANFIGGSAKQQTLGMTLGAFIFAFVVFLIRRPELSWQIILLGIVGGLIWSVGQSGQFYSMKYLGVAMASPLSGGFQLVLAALLGVFVFGEWIRPIQYIVGFLALAVLIIAFYFSAKKDPENTVEFEGLNLSKGFIALIYSTIGYVTYVTLFNNLAQLFWGIEVDTLTIILPMSFGMIAGALILAGGKVPMTKEVGKNMLLGLQWGLGNVFLLLAANEAGITIALTFSQLGVLLSTIGSILFLGEKKTKKELTYLTLGGLLFALGAILLAVVKIKL